MDGPQLFVRYAYPPNQLGYCGPDDVRALVDYGRAGVTDPGLRQLVAAFEGAWPYLQVIATAARVPDPLDRRVVEAYWLGNRLLLGVGPALLHASAVERFRSRAGRTWDHIAEAVWAGGLAHHSFHVFGVYPWVGLMRGGTIDEPLQVLDACRIRWGRVLEVRADLLDVQSQPLVWDGAELALGPLRTETVSASPVATARPGDWVSLHWGWVCDVLSARQLADLRGYSAHHLRLVNEELSVPLAAAG